MSVASTDSADSPAPIRFGSVCSGIEAASVAWHGLGWQTAWVSEIEPWANAALNSHYPDVPNHGDMNSLPARIRAGEVFAPDVLVGGTPCQAFSVAGQRGSLSDARGNLTLTYVEILDAIDIKRAQQQQPAAVAVWENVPGVLNTPDNAFGCFMGALAGSGGELQPSGRRWTKSGCVYGPRRTVAWRVFDAQYFGLAQRRERVFVVASARTDLHPTQILFEHHGLRRDSAPSRSPRQDPAEPVVPRLGSGREYTGTLMANMGTHQCAGNQEAFSGHYHVVMPRDVVSIGGNIIGRAPEHGGNGLGVSTDNIAPTLTRGDRHAVAFDLAQITSPHNRSSIRVGQPSPTLTKGAQMHIVSQGEVDETSTCPLPQYEVRRLMPIECERLQGFPDNYTLIPYRGLLAKDTPRYTALGNSMAVPVMRWLGFRINIALKCQMAL